MAKRESSFINMTLTLFLVALVASTALGYVYELTKEPIRLAKEKKVKDAIITVLPQFDSLGTKYKILPTDGKDSLVFFPTYTATGKLIGTAVKTYTYAGFSGYIGVMVGITPDGNISNYSILNHKETPGLGTKMQPWFMDKEKPGSYIIGKNPSKDNLTVSKDGGDIDAITAATISARAFLDAIDRAARTLPVEKGGKK